MKFQNKAGVQVTVANEVAEAADSPSAAPTPAQLANAESDRLDALEEAECAAEDRDGYRRELARVRAQVRDLEAQLRTEKHEHAETRRRMAAPSCPVVDAASVLRACAGIATGPASAYDLNPTAAQLCRMERL